MTIKERVLEKCIEGEPNIDTINKTLQEVQKEIEELEYNIINWNRRIDEPKPTFKGLVKQVGGADIHLKPEDWEQFKNKLSLDSGKGGTFPEKNSSLLDKVAKTTTRKIQR